VTGASYLAEAQASAAAQPLVLLTGAAGRVATLLRQQWGRRYRLRLADVRPVDAVAAHEEYQHVDVRRLADLQAACAGVDTVVHLAADPTDGPFMESLLPLNIVSVYNAFEAAKQNGCRRIVWTSSIMAVKGRGPVPPIESSDAPHPHGLYGATKAWG